MRISGRPGGFSPVELGVSSILLASGVFLFAIQTDTPEAESLSWWLRIRSVLFACFIYLPLNVLGRL